MWDVTATQVGFAFVAIAIGLQLALCGRRAGRLGASGPWRGAAASLLACWAGLLIGGAALRAWFPDYPERGPPERVGLLFVIPGLALGAAAVLRLLRRAAEPTVGPAARDVRTLLLATLLVAAAGLVVVYAVHTWPGQRALPWSAREVRDPYRFDPQREPLSWELTARMSEDDARAYAERLGLTPLPTGSGSRLPLPRSAPTWEGRGWAVAHHDGRLHVELRRGVSEGELPGPF